MLLERLHQTPLRAPDGLVRDGVGERLVELGRDLVLDRVQQIASRPFRHVPRHAAGHAPFDQILDQRLDHGAGGPAGLRACQKGGAGPLDQLVGGGGARLEQPARGGPRHRHLFERGGDLGGLFDDDTRRVAREELRDADRRIDDGLADDRLLAIGAPLVGGLDDDARFDGHALAQILARLREIAARLSDPGDGLGELADWRRPAGAPASPHRPRRRWAGPIARGRTPIRPRQR